jgi:hypothetical protein
MSCCKYVFYAEQHPASSILSHGPVSTKSKISDLTNEAPRIIRSIIDGNYHFYASAFVICFFTVDATST